METTNTNTTDNSVRTILEDNSGGLSAIRVLMLVWGVGVFAIWATGWIIGMINGIYTPPTLPNEIVTILLGITGIKCVQRFGEKPIVTTK